jgi:hypothetical protein
LAHLLTLDSTVDHLARGALRHHASSSSVPNEQQARRSSRPGGYLGLVTMSTTSAYWSFWMVPSTHRQNHIP